MRAFEEQLGESFAHLLKEADSYFEETGKLHSTLEALARRLEGADLSYAVLGAIAMARYGYRRMTVDIDVLLSPEGRRVFESVTRAGAMSRPSAARPNPFARPIQAFE